MQSTAVATTPTAAAVLAELAIGRATYAELATSPHLRRIDQDELCEALRSLLAAGRIIDGFVEGYTTYTETAAA